MHADEAILADKFGSLLERGSYQYDPTDYHGPVLAYLSTVPAFLTGRTTYPLLSETVLRVVPAIAGILLALSPLLLTGAIGETAAVIAALFVATSPSCVFYSRYYIPEMLLALFTAAFLAALWRVSVSGSSVAWASAGVAAALMLATKETAAVALAAVGLPCLRLLRARPSPWFFLGFAVLLIALVHPLDLMQSFAAYWHRGTTTSIHNHPAYYYLDLLSREAVLLLLGFASLFLPAPQVFTRLMQWYMVLLVVIYSAIPYKTPWIVVNMVFILAVLSGVTLGRLRSISRRLAGTVLVACAGFSVSQAYESSFLRPADPRNPWVYAQTTNDVLVIRDAIQRYGDGAAIAIYTRDNLWPLPWYLRKHADVRWSREVGIQGAPAPIVLASPYMESELQRKFYEGPPPGQRELYINLFREPVYLRPGVEVRGYVRKSLWDATP